MTGPFRDSSRWNRASRVRQVWSASRDRSPVARSARRPTAARTSASVPTIRTDCLGPGDGGVEELARQQPGVDLGQQHGDVVGLAALALVDRQRVHGLDLGEPGGGEVEHPAAGRRHQPAELAVGTAYDDPGLAVVDAEAVVVVGDQDRAAGVPARPVVGAGGLGEAPLDEPVPVGDAAGAVAVGADQPVAVERRQRRRVVAGLGGERAPRRAARNSSGASTGSGSSVSSNRTRSPPARSRSTTASASPSRRARRERADLLAEAVGAR